MKYSAQNLAKAFFSILEEKPDDSQAVIKGFVIFCKTKRLTHLLPSFSKYLKIELQRGQDKKTLKIFAAVKVEEKIIKKIRELAKADSSSQVEIIEDKDIVAGFIAYYKNKIIDASLSNNLRLLKNKLINA